MLGMVPVEVCGCANHTRNKRVVRICRPVLLGAVAWRCGDHAVMAAFTSIVDCWKKIQKVTRLRC